MSVISCKLLHKRRITVDGKRNRTYQHEWLVKTDDPSQGLLSLLLEAALIGGSNDQLPSHRSVYNINGDTDMGVQLQDVTADGPFGGKNDIYYWRISGTWKPPEKGQGSEPLPENPLDWPIKYHAETSKFTRKATRDIVDDRLIANSAGDLFENVEYDDGREILTAIRNEFPLSAIIGKMRFYRNAINADEFLGAPPGAAKIDSITLGGLTVTNDVEYYPVTYRVEFASEGEDFYLRLDNRGNMAYDKDKNIEPSEGVSAPVKERVKVLSGEKKGQFKDWAYLAYDGTQLPDGSDPLMIPQEGEDPFRLNQPRPFAGLGIA